MKRRFKILVLAGFLFLLSLQAFSQLSVSFYNSSTISKIGMAYNFGDRFWSELRVYSNTFLEDLTPELVVCFNVVNKESHNVYVGIGATENLYSGILMPLGVQISPLPEFRRLSLHMELQPMLDFNTDFIIQSSFGIRFKFGRKV